MISINVINSVSRVTVFPGCNRWSNVSYPSWTFEVSGVVEYFELIKMSMAVELRHYCVLESVENKEIYICVFFHTLSKFQSIPVDDFIIVVGPSFQTIWLSWWHVVENMDLLAISLGLF